MKDSYYEVVYVAEKNHWWYRVRRELVHFLIKKYSTVPCPKVLDVGCGTGGLLEELSQYSDASGVDVSEKAVAFCRARGISSVTVSGAEALPFPDGTFDVVLALDVLEHLKDEQKGAREMYRVLKPGGVAIVFVPAFMFLWGVTDEASHHFRRYTKKEIVAQMASQNFTILRASYFNTFLFPPVLLVRTLSRLLPKRYKPEHETNIGSGIFNGLLYAIFKFETMILRRTSLPFGVSVLVIGQKK